MFNCLTVRVRCATIQPRRKNGCGSFASNTGQNNGTGNGLLGIMLLIFIARKRDENLMDVRKQIAEISAARLQLPLLP
jgi:hypothetical protein